jgi:hypothetical protein
MPWGSTGFGAEGEGDVPGRDGGGAEVVGDGDRTTVGVDSGFCLLGREKIRALKDAPATAEVAATIANVVFDIALAK